MYPGTRNFTKFKSFNFLQLSWPRVHETSQNSKASIFSSFHDPGYTKLHKNKCFNFLLFSWPRVHETSLKSNTSIFSNFHDPGYTKLQKIQILQFSLIFMTLGTWNFTKTKCFNFLQFSWPWVHETSLKSNASIPHNFHDRRWNFTKFKSFNFLQLSWPRVHET